MFGELGRCQGPRRISRRDMIEIGVSAALGLNLPGILRAQDRRFGSGARLTPTADACILVFLDGGPSHLDMWDMKPDAPAEIRGEFRPIATRMPGISVSEHLPRLSTVLHMGTLIRSAHHSVNNSHGAAVYTALTGLDRGEVGGTFRPTDHPAIGAVVGLCRPPRRRSRHSCRCRTSRRKGRATRRSRDFSGAGWDGRTTRCSCSRIPMPPTSPCPSCRCHEGSTRAGLRIVSDWRRNWAVLRRAWSTRPADRGSRPVPVQGRSTF